MSNVETKKELPKEQHEELLVSLKARFEKNMNRHKGVAWFQVQAKLETHPEKLWSLSEMEKTGGEMEAVFMPPAVFVACSGSNFLFLNIKSIFL